MDIKVKIKHTRKLTKKDLYFIVNVFCPYGVLSVGWIDEKWNKEDFEKQTGYEVISVEKFTSKKEYNKKF